MKKILALGFALSMIVLSIAGCTSKKPAESSETSSQPTIAASVKTGLAVVTSVASSKDAGEKDGVAQIDSTIVAVTVDADGKITGCTIDAAQTKINFSAAGKLVTDKATVFKSKNELGTEYGMSKASKIGKEWNEQAAALAAYVVGKTVSEVKGIAVDESGYTTNEDLKSSVTMHVSGFLAAIEKAVTNAKDMGAKEGDKLGLGVVTNIAKSKDASAEGDGLGQAYSTYAAVTFGSDSKITSCVIDASQSNVNFSTAGKVTTDLKAELKTKDELGDAYGMKAQSKIGKEWNEQAAAFAAYVKGKTAAEVSGIALTEGAPSGEDLKSSVTIHVTDFQTIITKADANKK